MDDHHSGEHNAHIGPDAHLPDPSIWPIVVGLAAFLLGGALIWWARDPGNDFAGPFLGAAIVVALVSAAGWAYEDGRMKRAAEGGGHGKDRNARYTQVITFAVPEGQFEAASAADGVIGKIDSADTALRDLAGFQDLRIVAAPAETGPSQVLVETTWSDREGLATYDETRQTVLDMVGEFEEQVVPGTVQVFDTVVVRDTKDVAVKFGMGTAATMIGGLAVFGLLIGAGLSIFEGEGGGGGEGNGGGPTPPAGFQETGEITSRNIAFNVEEFSLPPQTEITLTYTNLESTLHNFQVFDGADASAPFLTGCSAGCADGTDEVRTAILGLDESVEFTFTTPDPGTYFFNCALHPVEMQGTITIEEGAPIPGEGGGDGGNGDGGDIDPTTPAYFEETGEITSKDILFNVEEFSLPPETEITLKYKNLEATLHNFEVFNGQDTSAPYLTGCISGCAEGGEEVKTAILGLNEEVEFTFTSPGPGTYFFHCILHPVDMQGFITVEEGAPIPGGGSAPAPEGEGDGADGEGDAEATEEPEGDA